MILFSTLSQGYQLWLFCYLGLISGLLFFATIFLANFLTKKGKLKIIFSKKTTKSYNSPKISAKIYTLSTKDDKNLVIKPKNDNNTPNLSKENQKSGKNKKRSGKASKKDKKRVQNENRKKNRQNLKRKLCTFFAILWKFFINFATEILAIFVLCVAVAVSLLTNLRLNYGLLPPICVLFWILSFLLAKFFLKTLAKIFLSIYNKHIKSKENSVDKLA